MICGFNFCFVFYWENRVLKVVYKGGEVLDECKNFENCRCYFSKFFIIIFIDIKWLFMVEFFCLDIDGFVCCEYM